MSAIGNDPTVGGEEARKQCEATILAACHKLIAMVSEAPVSYDRALYLAAIDEIDDARRMMARLRIWEATR